MRDWPRDPTEEVDEAIMGALACIVVLLILVLAGAAGAFAWLWWKC